MSQDCVAVNAESTMLTSIISLHPHDLTYQWDFGDGTTLYGTGLVKAQHTYTMLGDYIMTVVVSDSFQTARHSKPICVQEPVKKQQLSGKK